MSERITWEEARLRYEHHAATFTALAPLLGCQRQTVARRAKAEAWIERRDLARSANIERRAFAVVEFIRRDHESIVASLSRDFALVDRLTGLVERHTERLENDQLWSLVVGHDKHGEPILVHEDPIKSARNLSLMAKTLHEVKCSIAGLRDDSWRGDVDTGEHAPQLPADFNFLQALRKKPKQTEEQTQ